MATWPQGDKACGRIFSETNTSFDLYVHKARISIRRKSCHIITCVETLTSVQDQIIEYYNILQKTRGIKILQNIRGLFD